MFFEKFLNEIFRIKNLDLILTRRECEMLRTFKRITRTSENIYMRRLTTIRRVAKMLDVPTFLLVRILHYERIEEFEKRFETS